MLLVVIESDSVTAFTSLLHKMKVFEQRKYLNAIISVISKHYLNKTSENTAASLSESSPLLAGVIALVSELIKGSSTLTEHLVASLTRSGIPALDDSISARRGVIAAIAKDEGRTTSHVFLSVKVNIS
jgi:telomere length regulation protein